MQVIYSMNKYANAGVREATERSDLRLYCERRSRGQNLLRNIAYLQYSKCSVHAIVTDPAGHAYSVIVKIHVHSYAHTLH